MSGKFEKNKPRKKKILPVVVIAAAVCVCVAAIFLMNNRDTAPEVMQTEQGTQNQQTQTEELQTEEYIPPFRMPLNNDLEVLDIGSYTGIYMEDGSDEIISGVLMIKLINNGEDTVEYTKITVGIGGETAEFTASTLKPGATVVLLEKNRMSYDSTVDYSSAEVICENLALFQEEPSIQEDKVRIQVLDGAINVTNISKEDISGNISIYYKNKAAGVYYGGITYRVTLEGGLKAGEIRQIMASHFSDTGSEVMFVTIAQ